MKTKFYKILRWACFVGIPAAVTLIATLDSIWGWSATPQIIATLSAVGTCLGAIVGAKVNKDENSIDGGLVIDDDYEIIDIIADEPDKKIAEGKTSVRLLVTKAGDVHYGN